MSRDDVIVQVLKDVDLYASIQNVVGPDVDVVKLFDENFDELVEMVLEKKSLPAREGVKGGS